MSLNKFNSRNDSVQKKELKIEDSRWEIEDVEPKAPTTNNSEVDKVKPNQIVPLAESIIESRIS